ERCPRSSLTTFRSSACASLSRPSENKARPSASRPAMWSGWYAKLRSHTDAASAARPPATRASASSANTGAPGSSDSNFVKRSTVPPDGLPESSLMGRPVILTFYLNRSNGAYFGDQGGRVLPYLRGKYLKQIDIIPAGAAA